MKREGRGRGKTGKISEKRTWQVGPELDIGDALGSDGALRVGEIEEAAHKVDKQRHENTEVIDKD